MKTVKIDRDNFDSEVLKCNKLVVVTFYTKWSGACRITAQVIQKVQQNYQRQIKFIQVNMEQQKKIATQYGIKKVPALVLFKNGVAVDTFFGLVSQSEIERKIETFLNKSL